MAPRFPCWRGAYEEDPQLRAEFLGFPELCLYADFVPSIDGIVALEQRESSGTVISGGSPADRFVMGLLRACAEAVVVAGGTFRATPNVRWTAGHIFPALADEFKRMRRDLKRAAEPTLVVVSARGDINAASRAGRASARVDDPRR